MSFREVFAACVVQAQSAGEFRALAARVGLGVAEPHVPLRVLVAQDNAIVETDLIVANGLESVQDLIS